MVLGQNITLVYDVLKTQQADSQALKEILEGKFQPMLMDTPEMVVAAYPPTPLVIQVADNRIRVSLQQQEAEIGEFPLWQAAIESTEVAAPASRLIAYGFNYDLGLLLTGQDAHELMLDRFLSNKDDIETSLGGSIWSFVPRFRFRRGETRYELVLDPLLDRRRVKVHLNVHFEWEDISLPVETLESAYCGEFDYLVSLLPRMLNEEG
jgi:hypothetical protein